MRLALQFPCQQQHWLENNHLCPRAAPEAQLLHQAGQKSAARAPGMCAGAYSCSDIIRARGRQMISAKILDQVSAAVSNVLPSQLSSDVKKNMRAALQSALEGLDLVTREELEVQEAVLARTREKLQELEKKIAALEKQLLGKK